MHRLAVVADSPLRRLDEQVSDRHSSSNKQVQMLEAHMSIASAYEDYERCQDEACLANAVGKAADYPDRAAAEASNGPGVPE